MPSSGVKTPGFTMSKQFDFEMDKNSDAQDSSSNGLNDLSQDLSSSGSEMQVDKDDDVSSIGSLDEYRKGGRKRKARRNGILMGNSINFLNAGEKGGFEPIKEEEQKKVETEARETQTEEAMPDKSVAVTLQTENDELKVVV